MQDHLFTLTQNYGAWVYAMLFAIIFAETGLVVTPVLPGDSLVFAVGAVAANPDAGLNIWIAGGLMLVAAIIGDTVNYWVGAKLGLKVQQWFPRLVRKSHIERTPAFFEKYGGKTIIIARFVPIVRTYAPFVAGAASMPYPRFALYNITGAIVWVVSLGYAGYFFGNIPLIKDNLTVVIITIIILSILPGVFEYLRLRKRPG